jgi:hypothetical protein
MQPANASASVTCDAVDEVDEVACVVVVEPSCATAFGGGLAHAANARERPIAVTRTTVVRAVTDDLCRGAFDTWALLTVTT